jgi:hypothetical protein
MLRGEISAIETYTQATEKFADSTDDDALGRIRDEHEQSSRVLRELIIEGGGIPDTTSGAWGGFAQAMEGAATLFGESPALLILEQGEQHGIKKYEAALADPDFSAEAKAIIERELLAPLYDHLRTLKRRRESIA